ncbi:hypothetical protein D7X33_34440 [Butyricicoccus sp. 1XD8-22]|nr:hypothetical protein D7X33_34440 [Butyricicoccus sp. 1XD8-22]
MEIPRVTISSEAIRNTLTELINEFIRIEKSETGLAYQQKTNYTRGKISLITSFINEEWNYKKSGQSYYNFLRFIVEKYELSGVWRIDDLK